MQADGAAVKMPKGVPAEHYGKGKTGTSAISDLGEPQEMADLVLACRKSPTVFAKGICPSWTWLQVHTKGRGSLAAGSKAGVYAG